MTVNLRYAARSDVGLVRSNNQDSAYAGPHLLVVADGMGGHAGGDVASSLTIAALTPLDHGDHSTDRLLADLEQSVDRARQDLITATASDPELAGMGTTVTALLRSGNTLAMAHLGDSRAYLLRDGLLTQVTVDHTFVQHLVDTGRISADEAETHPQRNVVMRVLGDFDLDLTPDMSVREAIPGDRWMLCSDGLSGFVSVESLTETLGTVADPAEAAERLVSAAMREGSTDNISVVVADVVDEESEPFPPPDPEIVGAAALRGVTAAIGPGTIIHPGGADAAGPGGTQSQPSALGTAVLPDSDPNLADALEHAVNGSEAGAYEPEVLPDDGSEDEVETEPAPRRRPWLVVVGTLLLIGGLGVAGWAGYRWTQTQYYVGEADGQVAVFRGIPATAGPFSLSTPVELTGTQVADLPGYIADSIEGTIRATSRDDALDRAQRLIEQAEEAQEESEPTPTEDEPTDEPTEEPTDDATSGSADSDSKNSRSEDRDSGNSNSDGGGGGSNG
ncbi:protein phosphatase 2C domain-containing protein [Myceligenerans pegani]|uniref:Protein phosphatase 2C domain-containing protein n=1 Tax=Myceligenerans pegani TaxID=2776917 RepID=A0ABR9N3N5_9MICO|nr:PP2C family serine/threonine-protein phosphatase [Myceligenerans sp. TRM 65318]MBE1877871.1 protein phosphatase 2C domain-containing protein [Myceligenerans sp. TRM 65318]MBE3020142.1 protein phosphatase 2C domain-containing protein [Myceligenerans sp. TRM 65318]